MYMHLQKQIPTIRKFHVKALLIRNKLHFIVYD